MKRLLFCGLALAIVVPVSAHADSHGNEGAQKLVAPEGRIVVTAQLDIALNDGNSGEPISIAPDVWYGLSKKLSLGLTHSSQAVSGFFGGQGRGICVTGEDGGCIDPYTGPSLLARYDLDLDGSLELAVDGGLVTSALDPLFLGAKLGVVGQVPLGPVHLLFAPNLYIGFTERDLGNKEALAVPVSVLYPVNDAIALGLQTGVVFPFEDADLLWRLPLSLVAQGMIKQRYFVYGAFALTALAGGDALLTGADGRTLTLGGGAVF